MYRVHIDFGDNAFQQPKRCETLTELSLYLERIPSMLGFEANGLASITIQRVSADVQQDQLPISH